MRTPAAALLVSAACLLGSGSAAGDDDGPIDAGRLSEIAGGDLESTAGYIVDRSMTNFGAQFARAFAQAWRAQGGIDGVDLTIVEKPSARWGSTVFVEMNNRQLVRVLLQSGRSGDIEPLALRSAQYLQQKLGDSALLRAFSGDDDLGREELP